MFQVATIEDKAVRIAPHNLALTLLEALTQQIEATYVDKVSAPLHQHTRAQRQALCHSRGRVQQRSGTQRVQLTAALTAACTRLCLSWAWW